MKDPIQSNKCLEAEDETATEFQELLVLWHDVHGDRAVTVRELLDDVIAEQFAIPDSMESTPADRLRDKLLSASGADRAGYGNTSKVVGQYLRKKRDQITVGYRITNGDPHRTNVATWRVEKVGT